MKLKTMNSIYEVLDVGLFRNGELYAHSKDIVKSVFISSEGMGDKPVVGGRLYVEYMKDGRLRGIKTSPIVEIINN